MMGCGDSEPSSEVTSSIELASSTEEDACTKHIKWWKIDDYKEWRENPNCTKYVDNSNTDSSESGLESDPFKTIQSAVNNAVAGDVICIKPGIYYEHHVDEENGFPAKDDFVGLFIDKIAVKENPIVIAAIGEGEVVIDGERNRDIGIYISHRRYDDGIDEFKDRPKFIEIHGLTVQNFKINGLYQRGCCIRFADNIVRNNGNAIPDVNPSALFLIKYDGSGRIVYKDNVPESVPYILTTDGIDNDHDSLIDEADESHEKMNIGRDGIYESAKSVGNMYVANEISGSGWYSKKVCSDKLDPECPLIPPNCLDANIANTRYDLFLCDDVKNILEEGENKDYKCINGKAYVNFPNASTSAKVLGSSLKSAALANAWMYVSLAGHGIYTYGSDMLASDNTIHDNAAEGLSLRDPLINSLISSNKIYNNAMKGIYYVSTGRDGEDYPEYTNNIITKNEIYNNGGCYVQSGKAGLYLGPDHYVVNSRGTTITDNYIHDNFGADLFLQSAWLNNTLGSPNCPEDILKSSSLTGCCPKNNIIKDNKIEGKVPIGPSGGVCSSEVEGADTYFYDYLRSNNTVVNKNI